MGGIGVIDQFLNIFTTYIDSGFGHLGGEVKYLDWAKSDMRKGHGDDGFAHQTDPLTEPDQMNERVARHRTLANVWTLMKRRKALKDVVVDSHPNL